MKMDKYEQTLEVLTTALDDSEAIEYINQRPAELAACSDSEFTAAFQIGVIASLIKQAVGQRRRECQQSLGMEGSSVD